jgi:hypothetical protein
MYYDYDYLKAKNEIQRTVPKGHNVGLEGYTGSMSESTSNTPKPVIYAARTVVANGYTLHPEVLDLDGDARVRVVSDSGNEIQIPFEFLAALASRAGNARALIDSEIDAQRKAFIGDITAYGLTRPTAMHLTKPDTAPTDDGNPVLKWVRGDNNDSSKSGWSLYLGGAENAVVGFAQWNDRAAIESLVELMDSPDSMMTIAGISTPEPIAALTARMTARNLRVSRSLPGIDLGKVRKILYDANLGSTEANGRYNSSRLRLLTIKSGGKNVPVAAAISAPSMPSRPLTEEENALGWREKRTLQDALISEARGPWMEKTKAAMIAAGWRVLDLNPPRRAHYYAGTNDVVWATRLDAETWSSVAAAANAAAGELEMSRGSVL